MSVTITGKTMDADHLTARLSVTADVRSVFYDQTNKRWRSGILDCIISAVTWSGTKEAGEYVHAEVAPPNYDPVANVKTTYDKLTTDATLGSNLGCRHVLDINYGEPDGSCWSEGDGTITILSVDIELPAGTTSSIIPVMTYTAEFSEYPTTSPISDVITAVSYSGSLQLGEKGAADWGMVTQDQLSSAYGAVVVQFTSITSSVVEQFPGGTPSPIFQVSNSPRNLGRSLYSPNYALPKSQGRTKYLSDWYTYVFAMNNGLISVNATPVSLPTLSKTVWDLCNFGITKEPMTTPDEAYLTFAYLLGNDQL